MTQLRVEAPDSVWIVDDDAEAPRAVSRSGSGAGTSWGRDGIAVRCEQTGTGLAVAVSAPGRPLARVALRWLRPAPHALVLGDAWERTYGDVGWSGMSPDRLLPWYWLSHDPATGATAGAGVRVRPSAFCSWTLDEVGTTLWLDLRNGGSPLLAGDREIAACTVVAVQEAPTPYAAHRELCSLMCDDPRPDRGPLVGCNDWYYAYGEGTSAATVLRDGRLLSELAGDCAARPFAVVDGGWSPGGACPGGPYPAGVPGRFDDMPGLAAQLREAGVRPGIWIRPTSTIDPDSGPRLRPGPRPAPEPPLDLTLPENLASVAADVAGVVGWGYELVKHDFSTFDLFGRFGPAMGASMTDPGWQFADRSVSNAEIALSLYRTIADAAGDAVVLGCNTVGHLSAGLVDASRTGDDTSGKRWERTRRMGVNTLAVRLAQHRTFFTLDADCVPATPATPWDKNRQLLDLVARSGTALFLSLDPRSVDGAVRADLTRAVRTALAGGQPGGTEPRDWTRTTTPSRWRGSDGELVYDWLEPYGAWPLLD